jgi:hypothetical protein
MYKNCLHSFLVGTIILLTSTTAAAQTPTDALMMPRGYLCNLLQYTHSGWDQYWEGETLRGNSNIGTVTTQNVMLMSALGITDRINVMVGLPYVWTGSDSYLTPQRGLQDLALFLKVKPFNRDLGAGVFNLFATGGFSTPVADYVPDFLPMSIGLASTTLSGRAILNYTANMGLYVTAQGGYTWRSNTTLDRNSYQYDGQLYETDEVEMPNVFDATLRLGFIKPRFQTELWIDRMAALDGDDIRYNEMPFPANRMEATTAGWMGKYFVNTQLAGQLSASRVLAGRNMGQATTFTAGILYQFRIFGEKAQAPQ